MSEIFNNENINVMVYKNTDSGNQDCGSRKYEITFPHGTPLHIVIMEAIKRKAILIGKCNGNGGGKYYIKGYPEQSSKKRKSYDEAKNDIETNLINQKYKTHDVYLIKYKN
jgi:hypothetical protein